MKIGVMGSGCSKCRSTIGIIGRAAESLGVGVEIIKVENPDEIKRSGVRATPAVVIDGKVVHSGGIPSHDQVQAWLKPGLVGFLNKPTRHLFFTGKGGVGKTSLPVGAEHRPRHRGRVISPAGSCADGRECQRGGTVDRARAALRRLHHGDRLVRQILCTLVRRSRTLRPHRLRHGPYGAHLASAQPAQGMDRFPGRQ